MADLMNLGGLVIDGHPNRSGPLPIPAIDDMDLGNGLPVTTCEPSLGNPPIDDYVISSKEDGTRKWVPQTDGGGGGGNDPYRQIKDIAVGITRFTTTLTTKPATVTLYDSNNVMMQNMFTQILFVGGVYVVDVSSAEIVLGVELVITY